MNIQSQLSRGLIALLLSSIGVWVATHRVPVPQKTAAAVRLTTAVESELICDNRVDPYTTPRLNKRAHPPQQALN